MCITAADGWIVGERREGKGARLLMGKEELGSGMKRIEDGWAQLDLMARR